MPKKKIICVRLLKVVHLTEDLTRTCTYRVITIDKLANPHFVTLLLFGEDVESSLMRMWRALW